MSRRPAAAVSAFLLPAICVAVGLVFGVSGLQKLFYLEVPAGEFAVWGYPRWFLFVVGATEFSGAILLQTTRRRLAGVAILSAVIAGATLTHLRHLEYVAMWRPFILATLLAAIVWLTRRPSLATS